MEQHVSSISEKAGLAPGSLVHVGRPRTKAITLHAFRYDQATLSEFPIDTLDALPHAKRDEVLWINCDGVHELEKIQAIGNHFQIHALTLEDIVNTRQRPKVEDYGHYLYITLKMLTYSTKQSRIVQEQVSLVIGDGFVLSFQERPGDVLDGIRTRLRKGTGRIRRMCADYLAYAIIDAIVDQYFVLLERIHERVDRTQQQLLKKENPTVTTVIHRYRQEITMIKKAVWPLRQCVEHLRKEESDLIYEQTQLFLRDLNDHILHISDNLEALKDTVGSILDTHLALTGQRLNEIMRVLTVFASLFLPLTFIAGIYGMNFEWMPELSWKWSYPVLWGVLLCVGGGMFWWFRRKRWW